MTANEDPRRIPTESKGNVNLLTILDQWVQGSIVEHVATLPIVWSTSLQALPSESEVEPPWVPAVVLYFELALSEEKSVHRTVVLPPYALTRGLVHAQVGEIVIELRSRRETFQRLVSEPVKA